MSRLKSSTSRLTTILDYNVRDVLDYICWDENDESIRIYTDEREGKSYKVDMTSQRYKVFSESLECVCCGLSGLYFSLQHANNTPEDVAHFNLYAWEDEAEVLMTKDHIIPKCKGGNDYLSNYQTMCEVCNWIKGNDSNISIEDLRLLRDIYNKNKDITARKELYALLTKNRSELKGNIKESTDNSA